MEGRFPRRAAAIALVAAAAASLLAWLFDEQALMRDVVTKNVSGLGATPPRVDVFADTWKFDWSIADFVPRQQWKPLATVNLDEGRH